MPEIVIDVAGESAGVPGVSRIFPFFKIDPTGPLVTLSLDDNTDITEYDWELIPPYGSSAVLDDPTSATPTFTPTGGVPGSYLVYCRINEELDLDGNGVAWRTKIRGIRIPGLGETIEFGSRGWDTAMRKVIQIVEEMEDGVRQRACLDYVDATAAPPTEVSGDRYILDDSGAPHADWDGASQLDIVEFDGDVWVPHTPEEGWIALVDSAGKDMLFVDDGSPAWEYRPLAEKFFDDEYSSGSVAGSGGSWKQQVQTLIDADTGLFQFVGVEMTSGTSSSTDIEVWNGDPDGAGERIYYKLAKDLTAGDHIDASVWWNYKPLQVSGEFYLRLVNHGAAAAEYDFRVRFKNDSE